MFGITDKILSYIGGGLVLILAVTLATVTISKNATIHTLNAQAVTRQAALDACNRDKVTLQNNQAVLNDALAKANASVAALQTEADTKYAQGATDRQTASKQAKTAADASWHIAQQRGGADLAASADALILEQVK